ncbi:FadR/GntR family transcriptional regulator [Streptomyces sp. KL116D]|uniref:FadR/GntR family transcriptional regulator n=1 Tax=Streptomyces sp. KL116D TaxID=3045152 RepID=UPI003557D8FE
MAESARVRQTTARRPPRRPPVGREVRVPKAADLVSRHLRKQIVQGELEPGAALPPESALMEQFGISRPTLREALRILESENLIMIHRGAHGGARITAPNADVAARYAGLILEYRGVQVGDVYSASATLEAPCARRLAGAHDASDIARLRTAVDHEAAMMDDPMALVEAQDAFHALLVELGGGETLHLLDEMLRYIVDRANAANVAEGIDSPEHHAQARKGHRAHVRLVDLIEAGKGEEAEKLWHRHIAGADHFVNGPGSKKAVLDLLD